MNSISEAFRRLWSSAPGNPANKKPPEVMLHDPAAQRPHDLDDPFYDQKVQERVASMISDAAKKK